MSDDHEDHEPPKRAATVAPYVVFAVCAAISAWAASGAPREREATSVAVFFGLAALVLPILLELRNHPPR